jgi:Eco29kI restriction endonuclease
MMSFDYRLHVFKYPGLESILEKAIDFFSRTPIHHLPPPEQFSGPGVYGLYYRGDYELYAPIATPDYSQPIYIGKAVAAGGRTARPLGGASSNLIGRLQEHVDSIRAASNLKIEDFRCRFMVLDEVERDLIVPVESELIRTHRPLWNTCISGFGIHTPGSGRFGQQPSEWDTLHPGRPWVKNLTGKPRDIDALKAKVKRCLAAAPS